MIIAILVVVGLCFGSFVNALVWRLREQSTLKNKKHQDRLSITKGRSMCPHCKHELAARDLLPIVSWLTLRGRCRYCQKPISAQYPVVELLTACLFAALYIWWPVSFDTGQTIIFILWLALATGFMALIVYDFRWMLLPDRLVYPLTALAALIAGIAAITASNPAAALLNTLLAVAVGGGIFYVLFQVSKGRWIGGGDVKLGWMLGLVAATPVRSALLIFVAAFIGSLVSVPLLLTKRMKRTSVIPFGPFLIIAAIIVQLFGHSMLLWYQRTFLSFTL
ncbi:MAG TPA: prepilin peptidase [Candidatus Saccharimonadales bacterium]|nr:prepilin peptidase [Candidatus Saccharimonadales bacterium]